MVKSSTSAVTVYSASAPGSTVKARVLSPPALATVAPPAEMSLQSEASSVTVICSIISSAKAPGALPLGLTERVISSAPDCPPSSAGEMDLPSSS